MKNTHKDISRLILNYLRKYPDSGDTLEGITKWWLEFEKIDMSVDQVALIVQSLVAKGLIKEYVTEENKILYKLNDDAW